MDRETNFQIMLDNLAERKYEVDNKPVQLVLGLSNVCNLHCSFCHYCGFCLKNNEKVEMLPPELLENLRPYLESAMFVNPSGRGEPFLYKHFEEFLEICRECGALASMQLTNNGTQLGRWDLAKLDGINVIAISVDSVDKKTFELLRYGAKLEPVLKNVGRLREALPDTVLQWSVVVNRLNITQLADIYRCARDYGVNYITFNNVYGYKEDKVIQLLRLRESDRETVQRQFDEISRLNSDNRLTVNNLISWSGSGGRGVEPADYNKVYFELEKLKYSKPYLSFDELSCTDTDSRRIRTENRKQLDVSEIRIPYCMGPFMEMMVQPNLSVCPCCASFGEIDRIEGTDIEGVWNGENYQNLREAMFNYDMLPDYCRECRSFMRYDYINEFWDNVRRKNGEIRREDVVIPPNFAPPAGIIKDKELIRILGLESGGKERKERVECKEKVRPEEKDAADQYPLNSKEYWDNRFRTDWQDFDGNGQTKFFAEILNRMLPEWLVHEVNECGDAVCDIGCAQGDALAVYKNVFVRSALCGEDFSENAIETAQKNYPEFSFRVSDLGSPDGAQTYPVVICSNVVEHFGDPYQTIATICRRSTKYTVILIPYREEPGIIDEHVSVFHTKDIPVTVEESTLVYAKSMKCESVYYPYEQILLVYAKGSRFVLLSDLAENVSSDREQEQSEEFETVIGKQKEVLAQCEDELSKVRRELEQREDGLAAAQKKLACQEEELARLEAELAVREDHAAQTDSLLAEQGRQIEELEQENERRNQDLSQAHSALKRKDGYLLQAHELCAFFANGRLMKLSHFLNRLRRQYLGGSRDERREFCRWLSGKLHGSNRDVGAGVTYNPWMAVDKTLKDAVACGADIPAPDVLATPVKKNDHARIPQTALRALGQDYTKYDVIILSVIEYGFRYQRPQQFADRFAGEGHRVFYVNSSFEGPGMATEEKKNLYVVSFPGGGSIYTSGGKKELSRLQENLVRLIDSYAVRDAVVLVDYPNWVYAAEFIREHYGFKFMADYMDDYTGFLGTAEDFLKDNCIRLLQQSDMVAASSQYLYDIAVRYAGEDRTQLIRNGAQTEHFQRAADRKKKVDARKVIGYYGAVAHWFAWKLVCFLAKKFPECDVVIIGEVTAYGDRLGGCPNLKLLGEKPYAELPDYLADFDVCLIPFDTSTDLIKATNPVKFYEYLAAGKKIVATEIPELMPYRDRFVYMSNEKEQFAEYVKLCLDGTDTLETKEACIAFAGENDWEQRFDCLRRACAGHVPKVSVVVLTYNNVDMNRDCMDSILKKTAYPNYRLIVVDNHSADGTREYLTALMEKGISNLEVIFNEENLGFAGGNNCGLRAADGDYVLLLNNDTVVTRGWMTNLVKHLENNPEYAMCNPVTNSIGNESKIRVDYTDRQEMEEFAYAYTTEHMGEEYKRADRMPLFSTIIRSSVVGEVGLLDGEYKVGMFEDDDYTERVVRAGYGITIAEDAFIHHFYSASFKRMDEKEYREVFQTNRKRFEEKWGRKWERPIFREGVYALTNVDVDVTGGGMNDVVEKK